MWKIFVTYLEGETEELAYNAHEETWQQHRLASVEDLIPLRLAVANEDELLLDNVGLVGEVAGAGLVRAVRCGNLGLTACKEMAVETIFHKISTYLAVCKLLESNNDIIRLVEY